MSEYLPQELLIKILTWLPPKTLIRFKCVSKTWNSLISSPYFISIHTQHQTLFAKPQIILRRYLRPLHLERFSLHREFDGKALQEDNVIEYPFRDVTRLYCRIVGSCNGVLCLSDDLFGMPGSVLLWNPSIKRKVVLPEVNMDGYWHVRVLGFGYDAEHNDYKVVKLSYEVNMDGYSGPPEAEVFLLSTKNWHKIDSRQVPEKCMLKCFWSQVFVNGNIHWLAFQKIQNNERQAKVENSIMLFDLSREVFDEIGLPETLKNELPIDLSALDVDGSLAVVHYSVNSEWDWSCEIWVMKKYRDERSWSKDYNVKFERGPGLVLGIGKMGQVILAIDNFGLVPYDPVTGKSAGLCVFGTRGSFYAGGYVESLALLDNGERAEALVLSDSEDERKFCEDYQDVEHLEVQKRSRVSQYLTTLLSRY